MKNITSLKEVNKKMITKDTTVSEVLQSKPGATHMLMSYGICNCCGGDLTLAESAEAKGVDIDMLLKRINKK
jgi:iron-sulfur cluster repair protein YtfE (RIC family)